MESEHLLADIPQKAFIVHDGKVLMTLDRKDRWEPPGGRLHKGEVPADGLKREIHEELAIDIEFDRILHTFVFVSDNGAAHHVVIYLTKPVADVSAIKMDEHELRGLKWIGPGDFEDLAMRDGYKDALRLYFNGR